LALCLVLVPDSGKLVLRDYINVTFSFEEPAKALLFENFSKNLMCVSGLTGNRLASNRFDVIGYLQER